MIHPIFLDVEATGLEESDRLIQVAFKFIDQTVNELFKPPVPINLTAMAVHHITEAMVADKPAFQDSPVFNELKSLLPNHYLVAHNAKYDVGMLAKEDIQVPKVICTYKLAKYLDDGQFANHQLQYLRYYYGIEVTANAHDALGDVIVLEEVFKRLEEELIKKDFPNIKPVGTELYDRMVEISSLPSLVTKFSFGKYNGKTLAEIAKADRGYLEWLLEAKKKEADGQEDWIYSLNHYLTK